MNSYMNLNRTEIIVYWKYTVGNVHPFELQPRCAANVKIMFRRKDFNTTTLATISLTHYIYTMSETVRKILAQDDRLGCIAPKVKFQVVKGEHNVTCQPYKAISETTSNKVCNVTVPS